MAAHAKPAQVPVRQGPKAEQGEKTQALCIKQTYLQPTAKERPVLLNGVPLGVLTTLQGRPHAQG